MALFLLYIVLSTKKATQGVAFYYLPALKEFKIAITKTPTSAITA